uniref:Uncharacterized protein n=1 Tax=Ixodes ricinus TaxID=34613 RepID=A0A6B0U1H5_IXORI
MSFALCHRKSRWSSSRAWTSPVAVAWNRTVSAPSTPSTCSVQRKTRSTALRSGTLSPKIWHCRSKGSLSPCMT